uniref:Protein kinase domain-containing protein n=1 Tax=Oryza nivara TaxID=4536 RepID=A0A0E0IGD8_ORYNI
MRSVMMCCLLLLLVSAAAGAEGKSEVALLLERVKPALQGEGEVGGNAQLATWTASTPLCQWRGLRWSTAATLPRELPCGNLSAGLAHHPVPDDLLLLLSIRLPASALAGHLPPELAAFSALASIFLAHNSLSGPIPLALGNAPALSLLDLASNRLSGSLPLSIWNLCSGNARLSLLRLHGNALHGPIPDPAALAPNTTCDALSLLDLSANRLSGPFPSSLVTTAFPALRSLDLSDNRLHGPIPHGLAPIHSLNLSYNNFSGQLPPDLASLPPDAFLANSPALCGPPLPHHCLPSNPLTSSAVAAIVIALMAAAVVLASLSIGWAQGRWRRAPLPPEEGTLTEDGEGKLVVFQGGEHLTLEEVLNATGQVVNKASYCTVYKAKLAEGGGSIELRLLREGCCKDAESCAPAVRRIGRARHDNLVPLRAFYQGRRGEKLLVYDYFPGNRTLHELLHGHGEQSQGMRPALTWARRHKIALGVARALAYVHAGHGEAHGSVRSSNVLVDEWFVARVAEYAVHRLLVAAAVGKADGYRAPELQSRGRCSPRTDVYAFGILLLELLMGRKASGELPAVVKAAVLEEVTMMEVFDAEVARGVRSPAEEGLLQALKLAMGCCAPVASARPTMAEVVRQLEEVRPRNSSRPSAIYSPAEPRSNAGTPTAAVV